MRTCFVMSTIRKHSASGFTRNLWANSFLAWADERVTGRFWSGLLFVRCYACTWQRGKRLAVVKHKPLTIELMKAPSSMVLGNRYSKGKTCSWPFMEQLTGWVLFTNSPCAQKLFFMVKNGVWIFLAGINLDHNAMATKVSFCQFNNCHFFHHRTVLILGRLPGVPRPGAKVQLYRPLNLLFWLNTAQDKADTLFYF